ncbi:MAG: PhoH family protein [Spirochaetales bacterium]|nr:PhoH family protein [Spirochaetales bacterium]
MAMALDDTGLLAEVCGANDGNLRAAERALGARVFTRGNEIFLESSDEDLRDRFRRLVGELVDSVRDGMPSSPELVAAIAASIDPDPLTRDDPRGEAFKDSCVQVPGGFGKIYPRSPAQALFLKGLSNFDVCFAVGPAGTGKTYLAVAWALREILSKNRRKLVLTRPVVEAGESLGFLPGDLAQKISPYLRPLYDAMESLVPFETIRRLEDSHAIEIAPLAYMRGRSLNNAVIILDEAQNTTREQMKMFLTRLGQGSQAIITGDVTQVDLPRKTESGLAHAVKVLKDVEGIFVSRLDARDVVRNPLVRSIIKAYETED